MNRSKYGYLLLLFVLSVSCIACGGRQAAVNAAPAELTKPPYSSAEPQRYQAEIWQTRGDVNDKYFIATDGTKWRIDSAYGDAGQITTLHSDKDYVIAVGAKTFAEVPDTHGYETKREDMVRDISYGLLNPEKPAAYQKLDGTPGMAIY